MSYILKLAVLLPLAIIICSTSAAAQNSQPPSDNDDSYKLPLFVPKVAQPNSGKKVIFDDQVGENDEIYSLPKRGATKPSTLSPSAGPNDVKKNYSEQYEEYQRQMKVYNEQMAEYKKQLGAQQQQESQQPAENDPSYVLPGQYMPTKKTMKPKPLPSKPAAQPKAQAAQPAPAAVPQQQYQPAPQPAAPAAAQYNQRYNYNDESDRAAPSQSNSSFPNYYY